MVKRSRLEIYFDVLKAIEKGDDKPTRIVYKTNLSWITLKVTMTTLIDRGFIREKKERKSKKYYVTKKGRNALDYYTKSLDGLVIAEQAFNR